MKKKKKEKKKEERKEIILPELHVISWLNLYHSLG